MFDTSTPVLSDGPALILAVKASIADWPTGEAVVRDGLEV